MIPFWLRRCPAHAAGFSLLELLSAIAILIVIVGVVGQVFVESDRAWNLGTGRALSNTEARQALNMMVNDLRYAVADDILTFKMDSGPAANQSCFGFPTTNEIAFVSIKNSAADGTRAAQQIHYWVERDTNITSGTRFTLMRSEIDPFDAGQYNCYANTNWYLGDRAMASPSVVADNVVGLSFFTHEGSNAFNSATTTNLPIYVDIYLETLAERDSKQVSDMWSRTALANRAVEFLERRVKRHTARVYFENRQGYLRR